MKKNLFFALLYALVFTILFYKNSLGINLLIFESLVIFKLLLNKEISFKGKNNITIMISLLITGLFSVIINSDYVLFVNILVFFVWIGMLIYPSAKSLINALGLSLINIPIAQYLFFKDLSKSKIGKGKSIGSYLWKARIFIIPLIIIIIFFGIYNSSNPLFNNFMGSIGHQIANFFDVVFGNINFIILLVFLLGLVIINLVFFRSSQTNIIDHDKEANDFLVKNSRRGAKRIFKLNALKQEYKAGVFLLFTLNLLLLVLNITDIKFVWFGFSWDGQYLKQFVHEGTYLLILSIIISVGLVLYYFRGNINFYKNNKLLKYLAYAWIIQNIILTFSVAIRNFWYINYFSLAYKRIGVILFLLLCIYGLYTIFMKVKSRKSNSFLFRKNAYALLILLVISSLFNWDNIIAKYNFNHYEKSFVHLDYLSDLSDKCLPILDKTDDELIQLSLIQNKLFPFEKKYMTIEEYKLKIKTRKRKFVKEYESKGIWSWNLADYLTYRNMKQK